MLTWSVRSPAARERLRREMRHWAFLVARIVLANNLLESRILEYSMERARNISESVIPLPGTIVCKRAPIWVLRSRPGHPEQPASLVQKASFLQMSSKTSIPASSHGVRENVIPYFSPVPTISELFTKTRTWCWTALYWTPRSVASWFWFLGLSRRSRMIRARLGPPRLPPRRNQRRRRSSGSSCIWGSKESSLF